MKVRWGTLRLDTKARRLTIDEAEVHLSLKAFDLLVLLVERHPAVVDKATLRQRLWPGVHVVESSLSNLVNEIRTALAGLPDRLVRTVHGVGYALDIAPVDDPIERSGPARSPYLLLWHDKAIALPIGESVVGRDAACGVRIDSDDVSRRHARITVTAGERLAQIEDLASTNGTFVGGRRAVGPTTLVDGARLRLGHTVLTFRSVAGGDAATKRVRRPRPKA
ncbi:MAG: FHA domain-containing protein [Acidobacteriota bacterium]